MWTSNTTDLLDYAYSSHSEIPRILRDFAAQCIAAANQKAEYCYFGTGSLQAASPVDNLVQRINNVIGNLTTKSYTDPTTQSSYSMYALSAAVRQSLTSPKKFPTLAQYLMDAEYIIQSRTPDNSVNEYNILTNNTDVVIDNVEETNLTISSTTWNRFDPFTGDSNTFVWPAVVCLDQNLGTNNTVDWFVDKWYNQTHTNALVGYMSSAFSACLAWPNLTHYDVEKVYAADFPSKLKNKMLVIGVTDDPVTPYHSALNTYNTIGADNAEFLIHDGMGHCSLQNPNPCTTNAVKAYFLNGMSVSGGA